MIKTIEFLLFFFPFLFTCYCSTAQVLQIGVKGGLSLPNLTSAGGSDVSRGYRSISGPDFALVTDYALRGHFSLEAGLELSTQGGQKSGLQTIPSSPDLAQFFPPGSDIQYLYANFSSTVRLQYLMLPVLLKYSINPGTSDHWKLYIDGGFFAGWLISAKATASGSSKVYYDKEETQPVSSLPVDFDSSGNIKNQLHKANAGLEGNIGVQYQLKSVAFFSEAGGNYGFIDLQKNSQNGINHTGALMFRVGVFFYFKNNKN